MTAYYLGTDIDTDGTCKKCGGTGVLMGEPDFLSGEPVTMSACDCEKGQEQFKLHRSGNKAGYSTKKRMQQVAFESKLDDVLREMHHVEIGDVSGPGDVSWYEAACRSLVSIALFGVDEGARLRAIQYILDRKLGKAPQAVQIQHVDDTDPTEGMTDEERRELLAIALTT